MLHASFLSKKIFNLFIFALIPVVITFLYCLEGAIGRNDASLHGDNVRNDSKLSYVPLPGVGQLDVTKSQLKEKDI